MKMKEEKNSPTPSQQEEEGTHNTTSRRRGEALESAILDAAWDELSEVGYVHLTMEGIAKRASTNKAVVYRRWPNKARLVVAAYHKHLPKPLDSTPNTGDLREDVLQLMQRMTQPLQIVETETFHGLIADLGQELIASLPQLARSRSENKLVTAMRTILKNAELRGEVQLEKLSWRVISLPLDLLRSEILMTQGRIPDEAIHEIVDDIFIPLISCKK